MSASPRILSLDLGSQTLGLAEFHARPNGGLVLTGYRRRDILAGPVAETDRNRQISETLSAMMRELGIKNGPVDYAVSGQSVFARFIKLPFVDQDKIERIVAFEAQQNVPFPIEEVVQQKKVSFPSCFEVIAPAVTQTVNVGVAEAPDHPRLRH